MTFTFCVRYVYCLKEITFLNKTEGRKILLEFRLKSIAMESECIEYFSNFLVKQFCILIAYFHLNLEEEIDV